MRPEEFDAEWEAAKAGEILPPPGRFDDEAPDMPPPELVARVSNVVPIRGRSVEPDTRQKIRPALTDAFNALHARLAKGPGLLGASSGLVDLDDALDGWQRGCFYVIGGRTGMGKSIVGANIATGLAANGNGVDYLSLEMPVRQLALRCLLCEAKVPHYRIKSGTVEPRHWSAMAAAIGRMCDWPWMWDDRGGVNTAWILRHVIQTRKMMQDEGKELHTVVLDHVQKIRGTNERAPRREQMVQIVDDLKQLAKRENLCVLALAQIGRGTEARGLKDRRPRMADLQEAGAIEQEGDAVGLLYRADYYSDKTEWTNVLELNLPKVRDGEPKLVKLVFDGSRFRVDNMEPEDA